VEEHTQHTVLWGDGQKRQWTVAEVHGGR